MIGARSRLAVPLTLLVLLSACGITRIDAPVSFRADRRLSILRPEPDARVQLPVQVVWKATDFPLTGGNHFGLFVDRVPVGPGKQVRLRVCTEGEKQPPQAGSFRKVCTDDRQTVMLSNAPSFEFRCFVPRFNSPERVRNTHRVSIVLLDKDERRVGQAVRTIQFEVDANDAKRCRGL